MRYLRRELRRLSAPGHVPRLQGHRRKPVRRQVRRGEYIRAGGGEQYAAFRARVLEEINALLSARGLHAAETLYELPGAVVNLAYPTPGGSAVRLLDDRNIYLGCQIEFADLGVCYGVVADTGFILICSYSVNGSEPELIAYQKR